MPAAMRWSLSIKAVSAACSRDKISSLRHLSLRRKTGKAQKWKCEDSLTPEIRRQSAISDSYTVDSGLRARQRTRFRRSLSVTQASVWGEINGELVERARSLH